MGHGGQYRLSTGQLPPPKSLVDNWDIPGNVSNHCVTKAQEILSIHVHVVNSYVGNALCSIRSNPEYCIH